MELNEKLCELRKQKGLTQEELAERLYVSRTAISKWESGRGYPNIDSLKAIAKFFSVSVDELLSTDELLTVAENDAKQKEERLRDRSFGLLDVCAAMLLFLPFFGTKTEWGIQSLSLLQSEGISGYLRISYLIAVAVSVAVGILTLALQGCRSTAWQRSKRPLSLCIGTLTAILFMISAQPYASVFAFALLASKAVLLLQRR